MSTNSPSHDEDIMIYSPKSVPMPQGQIHHVAVENLNSPTQNIGLAHGKELCEEGNGAVIPCSVSIFVGIEPLLRLPQK